MNKRGLNHLADYGNRNNLVPRVLSLPPLRKYLESTLVSAGHVAPKIWVLTRMYYRGGVAKCKIVSVRMVESTGGDVSFSRNICGDKNSFYRQVFLHYIRTFNIEAVHVIFDSEKRLQVSEFQNTVAKHRHSQRMPARVTT